MATKPQPKPRADTARASLPVVLTASEPDTRQPVTLWALLCWVYQEQRAHSLGAGRSFSSRVRWMQYLGSLDADCTPAIHVDAGAVHRVVCGVLSEDVAWLIIEAAKIGQQPERSRLAPRPVPRLNLERGGAAHVVRGEWIEVPPIRLSEAERRKLHDADGRGEIERSAVPSGAHRWKYRVDLRPRRRCRKARVCIDRTGKLLSGRGPFADGDQVWSPYCPVDYQPDPAYVAMVNAVADAFDAALTTLREALVQVPFRTRKLVEEKT